MKPIAVAIVTGVAFVATAHFYYIAGSANYLGKDDPIGKEAGFGPVVAAANHRREAVGARWFVTTDYRMYSMLRWHLRDAVPVVQLNERSRYVAPHDTPKAQAWKQVEAKLQGVGHADLTWRGVNYDTYAFQTVTGWKPVFSSRPGEPLYKTRPN